LRNELRRQREERREGGREGGVKTVVCGRGEERMAM